MVLGSSTRPTPMLCLSSSTATRECCGPTITGFGDFARATLLNFLSLCLPSASITAKGLCHLELSVFFHREIALPLPPLGRPHQQPSSSGLLGGCLSKHCASTSNQMPCRLQADLWVSMWEPESQCGVRVVSGGTVLLSMTETEGGWCWIASRKPPASGFLDTSIARIPDCTDLEHRR
ncbi:hypothetical protein B0T21DRAFT_94448 [Apiosordaria backusii]|uniref:Uncharacterized protein n=1 Tax=Apiosordaria backusii TaxID=314023 RepID=A0AA40ET00_9PEZI|nr:hypothetical protein B0T21DRAFT_94448 [Apiosordaria backusii]